MSANAIVAQLNIGKWSVSSVQSHQGSRVLSFEEILPSEGLILTGIVNPSRPERFDRRRPQ